MNQALIEKNAEKNTTFGCIFEMTAKIFNEKSALGIKDSRTSSVTNRENLLYIKTEPKRISGEEDELDLFKYNAEKDTVDSPDVDEKDFIFGKL